MRQSVSILYVGGVRVCEAHARVQSLLRAHRQRRDRAQDDEVRRDGQCVLRVEPH
jgi:hypothetical protein